MIKNNEINEQLLFDPQIYKKTLLDLIESSQSEIRLSTYIFGVDPFGSEIEEALIRKSKQGVKVRLIVDGYGSGDWIREKLPELKHENLEVRVYHPLPWPFSKPTLWDLPRLDRLFVMLSHWNSRCHQKVLMVDETVCSLGSRNICNDSVEWRETNILVKGEVIHEVKGVFEEIWMNSNNKFLRRIARGNIYKKYKVFKDFKRIFSNHSFFLRQKNQDILLERIRSAKNHIRITTPYFSPTRKIFKNLCKKATSGVEVSILLPKLSDVRISKWISQMHYENLMKNRVNVYEYSPRILHAKSMIIDDLAVIGSSNFNRRSFLRDLEIDYSVEHIKTVEELNRQFALDIESSTKITHLAEMNFFHRILARMAIKIAPSWF